MRTIAYIDAGNRLVTLPVTGVRKAFDVAHALRASGLCRNVRVWRGAECEVAL